MAPDLLVALSAVADPRHARGVRHRLVTVLAAAVCAVLAGARAYVEIAKWRMTCWFWWGFGSGSAVAPSESTFRRVLQSVDADELDRVVAGWQADRTAVATADGALRAVAVDGKTPTTNAGQSSCPSTKSKPIKQATTECSGRKHRNLVKQEIWSLLLTHYAIRHVMKDAADTVETDPDDPSFIRSYRVIRRQVTNQAGFSPRRLTTALKETTNEITEWPNPPRRHRTYPRATKDTAHTATASNAPPTTANSTSDQPRSTSSRSHA